MVTSGCCVDSGRSWEGMFQASISGPVLTSLLNEVDHSDYPSYGILYGSYQIRIRQSMSDIHENKNTIENTLGVISDSLSNPPKTSSRISPCLGITHYLGTQRSFPFFTKRRVDVISAKEAYGMSDEDFEVIPPCSPHLINACPSLVHRWNVCYSSINISVSVTQRCGDIDGLVSSEEEEASSGHVGGLSTRDHQYSNLDLFDGISLFCSACR